MKLKDLFDKLPFNGYCKKLAEKITFAAKIAPFANYIVTGIIVALLVIIPVSIVNGKSIKPVVKILMQENTNDTRYWVNFIKKNGIDAIDSDGITLLLWALIREDVKLTKAVLKAGADPNRTSLKYLAPFDTAARAYDDEKCSAMLKILYKYGAKPVQEFNSGYICDPLMRSRLWDRADILLPYYKKSKNLDYTTKSYRQSFNYKDTGRTIISDSIINFIEKCCQAGIKFSYSDSSFIAEQYLFAVGKNKEILKNAIINNCNHKYFIEQGKDIFKEVKSFLSYDGKGILFSYKTDKINEYDDIYDLYILGAFFDSNAEVAKYIYDTFDFKPFSYENRFTTCKTKSDVDNTISEMKKRIIPANKYIEENIIKPAQALIKLCGYSDETIEK